MADFPFFKMAAVRHLRFLKVGNFNFRSTSEAYFLSLCQISRRSVEQFRRYGPFSILKMAAVRHLGFSKVEISTSGPVRGAICVITPNFAKIGQTVSKPIFDFQDGEGPSAILDLFYAFWDHPRRVFYGLCKCAKFFCNRRSNFDSMQI